jgi:hypothetical protein
MSLGQGNLLTSWPCELYETAGSAWLSLQISLGNRQSNPGLPLRAQILRTSFGARVPRRSQDWLPVSETSGRAEARYRLLETIREYALQKLREAGESTRLRDRHLELFVARTEEIALKLQAPSFRNLWFNWLDGEFDNIRAALNWAQESGQVEAGLRLAIALFEFWTSHGSMQEGRNWFERLLAQANEKVPIMLRARAAFNAGMTAGFLGGVRLDDVLGN